MTDSQKLDLLLEKMGQMEGTMQSMDNRLRNLEEKVQSLEDKVQSMDDRLRSLEDKVQSLEAKVQSLEAKVQSLEEKVQGMESRLQNVEEDVKGLRIILENEIRVNIQRVAEGHLDLSRIFHEAMRPNSEVEMLSIRVGMLESDMRKLKQKVG